GRIVAARKADYPALDTMSGKSYIPRHDELPPAYSQVPDRRRLQGVPRRASLARWRPLPALRQHEGLGCQIQAIPLALQGLQQERLSVLRHHRVDLREYEIPAR